MIAHTFLTTMFLLSGQWLAFLLNAPLLAFNINKCALRPLPRRAAADASGLHGRVVNKQQSYDATEIFRTLSGHKRECFIKLGFYLLSLSVPSSSHFHPMLPELNLGWIG